MAGPPGPRMDHRGLGADEHTQIEVEVDERYLAHPAQAAAVASCGHPYLYPCPCAGACRTLRSACSSCQSPSRSALAGRHGGRPPRRPCRRRHDLPALGGRRRGGEEEEEEVWCALGVVAQGRWGKASANHPAVEVVPRVILSKGGLVAGT